MESMELIRAFAAVPTGNVADALMNLGIPVGAVNAPLRPIASPQRRAAGYAVTVRQMVRAQAAEGAALARHGQVNDEVLQPGDLLVIDAGGRTDVCTGGALMALCAQRRGAVGWVVNGAVRDVEEIRALDFPVHLAGTSPVKSTPLLQTVGVNVPVEIGGVQILPGDVVVTDETGIVVVPRQHAEAVLREAQRIGRIEEETERLIREGCSFAEAKKKAGM